MYPVLSKMFVCMFVCLFVCMFVCLFEDKNMPKMYKSLILPAAPKGRLG